MKLKRLVKNLPINVIKKGGDIEITGLCSHSKRIAPGNLFIARKGACDDGAKYIEEAIRSGAAAVLSDMPNPFLEVAQLIYPDIKSIEAKLAARYYRDPSHALYTVGITGTNGKTTTAYLTKFLLDCLGLFSGLIGTIEYIVGNSRFEAERTTPDVVTNQKLLREMVNQGCRAAVMEVTSIGFDQKRVEGIEFDAAIFTNFTQDHLDYHKTMEEYADAKGKFFNSLSSKSVAVVNLDDPWMPRILKNCSAPHLTYGFSKEADLYAHSIKLAPNRTEFSLTYQNETVDFSWNLIGRYNILNAMAAIGVCLTRGVSLKNIPNLLNSFTTIPGRLERVKNQLGLHIFVDYAHTPDALENALSCLNEIKKKRIITVFGCGGDRDQKKRPLMASAVEKFSDFAIVTSDNPRSEDPANICKEIVQGFKEKKYLIELDRRQAIKRALSMAEQEDLILIAGKGHETYQIFAHQTIPFDDRKIAYEIANS